MSILCDNHHNVSIVQFFLVLMRTFKSLSDSKDLYKINYSFGIDGTRFLPTRVSFLLLCSLHTACILSFAVFCLAQNLLGNT